MNPYTTYLSRGYVIMMLSLAVVLFPQCKKEITPPVIIIPPVTIGTFTNPLMTGSDPWVIQQDSFYYYTQTSGNKIVLWKTKAMSKLNAATFTTVFSALPNTDNSSNVWAPELHRFYNKWYIYYTAGSGPDSTQRTWVLENSNTDPTTGTWIDKGRITTTGADFWGIDATVLDYNSNNYLLWSGRPNQAVQNQNIYIAKLSNAWTLDGDAVMISQPQLPWEKNGGPVNEGPQVLQKDGKTMLIYSASGCWTDDYNLGLLTLNSNSNPLIAGNWIKTQQPVFGKQPANNVYGPGHNAFFKSRSGTEDWIIYHANSSPGLGCGGSRNIRMQKFTWNADGTPNFGTAVKTGVALVVPAGETN